MVDAITDLATGVDESLAAQGNLEALLFPIEPKVFFGDYWNRKPVYIPGPRDKFAGLFDRAAFDRAVYTCADLKVGFTDERGWPGHFNIKPNQIGEMLSSGKTVCASVVDPGNPLLTGFLQRIRTNFALAGRFFFNSYLSPDGAGFGLHLDHHPVSILQIEGRKRWWYSREPGLKQVVTNVSFPKDLNTLKLPWVTVARPRQEDLCEVVLNPGDVLYLPKGTWHQAQAQGGSLALTLAMESVLPLELIQGALGPRLVNVALRSQLPGFWVQTAEDEIRQELLGLFDAALQELRSALNATTHSELYNIWRQVAVSGKP